MNNPNTINFVYITYIVDCSLDATDAIHGDWRIRLSTGINGQDIFLMICPLVEQSVVFVNNR